MCPVFDRLLHVNVWILPENLGRPVRLPQVWHWAWLDGEESIQYNTIQYSLFNEGDVITQWVI